MNEKLKPCPFCGKQPTELRDSNGPYAAICTTTQNDCTMRLTSFSVKDWNTRPFEDELLRQLAEAKAEIERLKTCEIELINHRKAITAINRFCVKVKP